jgi:DNA-binding NarL/FixJ family response regulator
MADSKKKILCIEDDRETANSKPDVAGMLMSESTLSDPLTDRDNELKGRQLGADDYVTKPIDFDLLDTIIAARLKAVARAGLLPKTILLNDREVEVLTWVARGKTSAEIAQILGLTKRTVDFHTDNARTKLDAATRTEAAIKAATGRLIEP